LADHFSINKAAAIGDSATARGACLLQNGALPARSRLLRILHLLRKMELARDLRDGTRRRQFALD
jgi:hypothetical protein